jgi:hypothetical protein
MKRLLISIVLASAMFSFTAMAQSAKFTAVYSDAPELIRSEACAELRLDDTYCSTLGLGNTGEVVAYTMASIKVPQSKELLVGLSAQVELFTETLVRGKKGTTSTATAFAEGGVRLFACNGACYEGEPGRIVLSNRTQELEATLGGVIESCTLDLAVDFDLETASGSFDLDDCVVEQESIRLALTTMSANHFNFVFPNLPQGDYEVIARFDTNTSAAAAVTCDTTIYDFCVVEDGSAGAAAVAIIGKYMMTVQEVRAVKNEGGDPVVVALP